MHDLLFIPQTGDIIPSPWLSPAEKEQVLKDWQAFPNSDVDLTKPPTDFWVTAAMHIDKGGEFRITSEMKIPRYIAIEPEPASEAVKPELATVINLNRSRNITINFNQAAA
ncbi:hypothetical protein [Corynebacterium sp.]|uniref:hypothetical protein n=1 Tax=Corynebacterium sp. TaxID=1720 RepID=UPI0028AACB9D|nr:hypothetical protein [Corynebacterium sp.]